MKTALVIQSLLILALAVATLAGCPRSHHAGDEMIQNVISREKSAGRTQEATALEGALRVFEEDRKAASSNHFDLLAGCLAISLVGLLAAGVRIRFHKKRPAGKPAGPANPAPDMKS